MRTFILVMVLIFSFQSWTRADDISEFEIEGISVGDSALDFYTESEIKNNTWDYYKNKKFTPVQAPNFPFYTTYDAVDFEFKTGDKNYIIYSLSGIIKYGDKNIEDCYKKMDEIDKDLKIILSSASREEKATWKHGADPTGESIFTDIYYELDQGSITITCYDFSKEYEEKKKFFRLFSSNGGIR